MLFARTQLIVVYESVMSYNVTAGVGRFDGSYVLDFVKQFRESNPGYEYVIVPYSVLVMASNLALNPMYSTPINPVTCRDYKACQSYLLSGGLSMTRPSPPTNYTSCPVITIRNVPSIQIDFMRGIHNDTFNDTQDCAAFGEAGLSHRDQILLGEKPVSCRFIVCRYVSLFFSTVRILKRFRDLCVYR